MCVCLGKSVVSAALPTSGWRRQEPFGPHPPLKKKKKKEAHVLALLFLFLLLESRSLNGFLRCTQRLRDARTGPGPGPGPGRFLPAVLWFFLFGCRGVACVPLMTAAIVGITVDRRSSRRWSQGGLAVGGLQNKNTAANFLSGRKLSREEVDRKSSASSRL